MVRLEPVDALAVKNWPGRRPGEKVDESRTLMARDGGRIRLMVMVGDGCCPPDSDGRLMGVVKLSTGEVQLPSVVQCAPR
jgi:hypothetical protein